MATGNQRKYAVRVTKRDGSSVVYGPFRSREEARRVAGESSGPRSTARIIRWNSPEPGRGGVLSSRPALPTPPPAVPEVPEGPQVLSVEQDGPGGDVIFTGTGFTGVEGMTILSDELGSLAGFSAGVHFTVDSDTQLTLLFSALQDNGWHDTTLTGGTLHYDASDLGWSDSVLVEPELATTWNGEAQGALLAALPNNLFIDVWGRDDSANLIDPEVVALRVHGNNGGPSTSIDVPITDQYNEHYIRTQGVDLSQFGVDNPTITQVDLLNPADEVQQSLTPYELTEFGYSTAFSPDVEQVRVESTPPPTRIRLQNGSNFYGEGPDNWYDSIVDSGPNYATFEVPGAGNVENDILWLFDANGVPMRVGENFTVQGAAVPDISSAYRYQSVSLRIEGSGLDQIEGVRLFFDQGYWDVEVGNPYLETPTESVVTVNWIEDIASDLAGFTLPVTLQEVGVLFNFDVADTYDIQPDQTYPEPVVTSSYSASENTITVEGTQLDQVDHFRLDDNITDLYYYDPDGPNAGSNPGTATILTWTDTLIEVEDTARGGFHVSGNGSGPTGGRIYLFDENNNNIGSGQPFYFPDYYIVEAVAQPTISNVFSPEPEALTIQGSNLDQVTRVRLFWDGNNNSTFVDPLYTVQDANQIVLGPGVGLGLGGETISSVEVWHDGFPGTLADTEGGISVFIAPAGGGSALGYYLDTANPISSNQGGKQVIETGNGKYLVAAIVDNGSGQPAPGLWCFTSDGVPDPTFGTNGLAIFNEPGYDPYSSELGLALDPTDGTILMAATLSVAGDATMVLLRYAPEGVLEPTWGAGGILVIGSAVNVEGALFIQDDGDIVHGHESGGASYIHRRNYAGAFQTACSLPYLLRGMAYCPGFGPNSYAVAMRDGGSATRVGRADVSTGAVATSDQIVDFTVTGNNNYGVSCDSAGKITVTGKDPGGTDFASMFRTDAAATPALDPTLNGAGLKAWGRFPEWSSGSAGEFVQELTPGGDIIAGGWFGDGSQYNGQTFRADNTGNAVGGYGPFALGIAEHNFGSNDGMIFDGIVDSNGMVVVTGYSNPGTAGTFIARIDPADGTLDPTFGASA